jgi:ELAV like protein 2/3/4
MTSTSFPSGDVVHRNLMINFIPNTWTSDDLVSFFQQYGAIEEAKVPIDKATGSSKGYGFVKFITRQDAETALAEAQGMQIDGKQIKIQKAALGKMPAGPVSLYLAGFDPVTFGMSELRQLFEPHGNVSNVKVIPSQPGKKGVAFVTLESWADANAAAEALNGIASGGPNGEILVVRIAEANTTASGARTNQPSKNGPIRNSSKNSSDEKRFQPYKRQAPTQSPAQFQTPVQIPRQVIAPQPFVHQPQTQVVLPQIQQLAPRAASIESTIFVYGVPGMNDAFLYKLFAQFGAISGAQVPEGKNFGFVKMPNISEAQNAVNTLNGCMLQGATVPLQVSFKGNQKNERSN